MNYSEKLKNPLWQRKRLEILTRDNYTCQMCNSTDNTLHIHHRHYIKFREPWDYPDSLLVTLCQDCHKKEEECADSAQEMLHTLHHWGIFNTKIIETLNLLIEEKLTTHAEPNGKRLDR